MHLQLGDIILHRSLNSFSSLCISSKTSFSISPLSLDKLYYVLYRVIMKFEWDENKNEINKRKG